MLQERQSTIIHNNLKKTLSNYKELSLPRFTDQQIDTITKGGSHHIFSQDEFDKYVSDTQDKLEKGYLNQQDKQNYDQDVENISKAIHVDKDGNEKVVYLYSLLQPIEEIVKSESGEEQTLQKFVYKDNPVNRNLERVGQPFTPQES